jgi:hypothetical protein
VPSSANRRPALLDLVGGADDDFGDGPAAWAGRTPVARPRSHQKNSGPGGQGGQQVVERPESTVKTYVARILAKLSQRDPGTSGGAYETGYVTRGQS